MRRWLLALGLVGCAEPPPPAPVQAPPTPLERAHAVAMALAGRVPHELDCEGAGVRYVCNAAALPGGLEAVVPEGSARLYGLHVVVRPSRRLDETAREMTGVSLLAYGPEGAEVRRVVPSGALLPEVTALAGAAGRVLRHEADELPISPLMWMLLEDEPIAPRALQRDALGVGWEGEHPTRIYRVEVEGDALLLAFQLVGEGGFLHLFPLDAAVAPPAETLAELRARRDRARAEEAGSAPIGPSDPQGEAPP